MASRKSTRLRNLISQEQVVGEQPPTLSTAARTRQLQAPAAKKPTTKKQNEGKSEKVKSTAGKGKTSPVKPHVSPGQNNLSTLPPELMKMTLDNIRDPLTMSVLGRTCKTFYSLMMPRLYGRITVSAMFHAHIPKLIRTIEPLLTVKQKKQLKKEGRYKGQQERYESGIDENLTPICANYVRQIVVGCVDPGKKHKYIVERYLEELFKNLDNVEIVELRELTKSIGQSIASLKHLKALNLYSSQFQAEGMEPLASIKNLKHFRIEDYGYSTGKHSVLPSLIQNSKSTLQSLALETSSYSDLFSQDLQEKTSTNDSQKGGKHDFARLKSLTLSGLTLNANSIASLHKAIDFMRLSELTLGRLQQDGGVFYHSIADLASASQGTPTGTSLRSLSLRMSEDRYNPSEREVRLSNEGKTCLLSSFDTLTTLEIADYGEYPDSITVNTGLSAMVLQGILKHKNLRTLKMTYKGRSSDMKIPYLSAITVGSIIDGLPHLQEFQFAPEEKEMDKIGQALVRGTNLTCVTCFPHDSWGCYPPAPEGPGVSIIQPIVRAFLDQIGSMCTGNFVWADYYKLKIISVSYRAWEVASEFEKSRRGKPKPESIQSSDEKRTVLYRSIVPIQHLHIGYDPEFTWVEKADRDTV